MTEFSISDPIDVGLLSYDNVPEKAFVLHGCSHCEWKSSNKCPVFSGFDNPEKDFFPSEGICELRKDWLRSLTRPYKSVPTYTQWVVDFNKTLAQVQLSKEYSKLQLMEQQLEGLTINDEQYGRIEKAKNRIRENWFGLWKELVRFEDNQVSREMPKKIEHTMINIPLEQIHRIMRGDVVIDAELVDDGKTDKK